MEQLQGLSAEMYRAVITVVDDRMREISVMRRDFDGLENRMGLVEAVLVKLTEAQVRTEVRLDQLAKAQVRTEERLERLEATVEKLAEAQARTEARLERLEATVEKLAEAQARTEAQLQDLIKVVARIEDTQAGMKGSLLELTYQRRAGSYLGPVMRRVRAWVPFELEEDLEPRLPEQDYLDLLRTDLLMRGQPREQREIAEVWLAVEVSAVVDRGDGSAESPRSVERAVRRAGHLRKAGYVALPAVAGEQATDGAKDAAQRDGTLMILDGSVAFWTEALNLAMAS